VYCSKGVLVKIDRTDLMSSYIVHDTVRTPATVLRVLSMIVVVNTKAILALRSGLTIRPAAVLVSIVSNPDVTVTPSESSGDHNAELGCTAKARATKLQE
jgi:hypothetical protein